MPGRRPSLLLLGTVALVLAACGDTSRNEGAPVAEPRPEELAAQGGAATVEVAGAGAFAQPVPGLDSEQRRTFAVGNNFFNDNWVTAPASTVGRDGLGPQFNAQSCSSCHFKDGRGEPPATVDDPQRGLLLRLSIVTEAGEVIPHPTLGDQLQDRAIRDVPVEGTVVITLVDREGTYADGTPFTLVEPRYEILDSAGNPLGDVLISPRVAPAMFGVGLLEGVPAEDIISRADPSDDDGDGISGRAHLLTDPDTGEAVLGRFGWKASVVSVEAQNASAFVADIGITSTRHPDQPCTPAQVECRTAASGGDPEIDDAKLDQVTFYTRTLAVPARRDAGSATTAAGQARFDSLGCSSCHRPELTTGADEIEALDHQVIRPYTDLLLHDLGPDLADGRPDSDATGREWRTPPLWGLGLVETVNGHTRFLHDGRARSIEEAILWHGGEAQRSRKAFTQLDAPAREQLLRFLESL